MNLTIVGSHAEARLGVSSNGNWVLSGTGSCEDPHFENSRAGRVDDETQRVRVALLESVIVWSIVSADALESECDLKVLGLSSAVAGAPGSPHCAITHQAKHQNVIRVQIVLPSGHFEKAKEVMSRVVSTLNVGFRLSISGIGIAVPASGVRGPALDDFLERDMPLLSSNVAIEMESHR